MGVGCVLHTLNLKAFMIMRPMFTAFGEQITATDGAEGAGDGGMLRVVFMVCYLISLELDTWRDWAKKSHGSIAFLPTRWVQQALDDVFLACEEHFVYYRSEVRDQQ